MAKCLHLLIVFALWEMGSFTQTATALDVATDGETVAESLESHNVTSPILIAAPQNLNPGLQEPLPALPAIPESNPSEPTSLEASAPQTRGPPSSNGNR